MNRIVFTDTYKPDNWDISGSSYIFKNQLAGVDRIVLDFNSINDLEITLTTPVGDDIIFYRQGVKYYLSYNNNIQSANHNDITSITIDFESSFLSFTWGGSGKTVNVDYPFYEMSVVGDKDSITLYKDVDSAYDDDFKSGTGSYSLEPELDGSNIKVNPGYFYIGSQEYYLFNDMGVINVNKLPYLLDYIEGEPYFVVPECNIDRTFGYIKTPSNYAYDVEWIVPSGIQASGTIPSASLPPGSPSGYLPIVDNAMSGYKLVYEKSSVPRFIIPSGYPPSGGHPSGYLPSGLFPSGSHYLPILNDESNLVLTKEITSVNNIELYSMWLDASQLGSDYKFYGYITDKYGAPKQNIKVTWYRAYLSGGTTFVVPVGESGYTNEKGVVTGEIDPIGNWGDGFMLWASFSEDGVEIAMSKPRYIPINLQSTIIQFNIFQLDNSNIYFDCQPARTAMFYNMFGEIWNSNTAEETGTNIWGDPDGDGQSDHGDWESSNIKYKLPPINDTVGAGAFSGKGNYTIYHYCSGSIPLVSGKFDDVYPNMRVAVDGYWGQYLFSGDELSGIVGNCQNPAEQYYITQTSDYDADENFGNKGTINDVIGALGTYGSLYYVVYYNGSDYSVANHDAIKTHILNGGLGFNTRNFYFRGIAIYPILLDDNLDEAWSQNWTIDDITSNGALSD